MEKCLEGSLVAFVPAWCGGSEAPWMAHEAGDSVPMWLTTYIYATAHVADNIYKCDRPCLSIYMQPLPCACHSGSAATRARFLNLHRSPRWSRFCRVTIKSPPIEPYYHNRHRAEPWLPGSHTTQPPRGSAADAAPCVANLLEQPCPSVRMEVWYAVCLAALTALSRSRGSGCLVR